MTKKIHSLAIALVLFAGLFVACELPTDSLAGTTWTSPDESGNAMTISFTSDSEFTMSITIGGITAPIGSGTYSLNGDNITITSEGDSISGTVDGNTMTFEDGTVFTKQ